MSDNKVFLIERVPAEIFHKILDHINISEILYSFYNVCRRINAFLISYNRYKLDFRSISRSDFDLFYYIIQPKNIVSLILSDDDRTPGHIGLFISLIHIEEFYRLRSLTLLQIEERHLIIFLKNISIDDLISLTIKWRAGPRCRSNATQALSLLSSTISHSNLRYLDLSLWIYEIKALTWPTHCTLQYLRIDNCSFSEYRLILHHSPYLKTLIIHNWCLFDLDNPILSSFKGTLYNQLVSLTLENIKYIEMNLIEILLSLTPSLVHLTLFGSGHLRNNAFDGSRWKHFIRQNLSFLNKFQFCLITEMIDNQTIDEVLTIIIPFSNHFWIEKKRWFVTCQFVINTKQIRLYSMPFCQPYFEYVSPSNQISYSTFTTTDDNVEKIDGVRVMNLNLTAAVNKQLNFAKINAIFDQVTELELGMNDQWPTDSLQFLSKIFNLSHLVKISLNISFNNDFDQCTINGLNTLFECAPNVHTLHNHTRMKNAEMICSIVPRQVKYLEMKINRFNDMKIVLEQLQHLLSITFRFPVCSPNYPTKIIKWLKQRGTSFAFWCNSYSIHLWIDNKYFETERQTLG